METQARPRTAPRRPAAPNRVSPSLEPARGMPRTRSRTAPAAHAGSPAALAIPEPFNPYILPTDKTVQGWVRWVGQAAVLSIVATLIWDRGTSIQREVKGTSSLAAPAQWVSALILALAFFGLALSLGTPWGVLPLAACAVVGLRRALAADGIALTLEAATHQLARKVMLAGAGVGAWIAAVAMSSWAAAAVADLTSNPIVKMAAGAQAVESLESQTASVAESVMFYGTCLSGVLLGIAVYWWATVANYAAKHTAAKQAASVKETVNVQG